MSGRRIKGLTAKEYFIVVLICCTLCIGLAISHAAIYWVIGPVVLFIVATAIRARTVRQNHE